MTRYIARRTLQAVVVLFGVTVITFIILQSLPGGPARVMLGSHYTAAKFAALSRQLGLDRPQVVQYGIWVSHLVRGDFGFSYVHQVPVAQLLVPGVVNSAILGGMSIVEALAVGIPIGVFQARRRGTFRDTALTTISFVFYSMPVFFIGAIAILYLAVRVHIFPVGGVLGVGQSGVSLWPRLYHALLPSFVLASVQMAAWSRYMRSSTLETMVQDYMLNARAKGLTETRAVWLHGFRNALLPIITLLGLSFPALIGGLVVVESVFNYPGLGYLLWQGAQQYDFPVVLAATVVASVASVAGNFLADVLYVVVDPRIRHEG